MKTVTVAVFSPTGGTRRAAQVMADCLGQEQVWYDLMKPEQRTITMDEGQLLLLALPVYAGRVPAVAGLLDGIRGQNTPCVLLAAYGNRHYDDALAQMKAKLTGQGFVCAGGAAVITPHVFAPALGADRPNEEDVQLLQELARQVQEKWEKGEWTDVSIPGNPEPEPKQAIPVPKDKNMARCVRCGQCARCCPTGAMDAATLLWDNDKCINCMACVSRCAMRALSFEGAPLKARLEGNFAQPRKVEVFF